MANFFDQFDGAAASPAAPQAAPSNFFDQFDAPASAAPAASAAPTDPTVLNIPVGQSSAGDPSTSPISASDGPQDPGILQHIMNAASRVPQNLMGKLQAINPSDINQTVDSMAAGIPFSDRISAAAAAATGIGGSSAITLATSQRIAQRLTLA